MATQIQKRITLSDIARLSGVSKTTVSMILNGRGEQFRIKAETRAKVEAIAKAEGYRANANAKALKLQCSNVIGLVIPDLTNYGFASTAKTLERLCREQGLQLVIACSDDNPAQEKLAIERLLDRQIDVLVTAPTHQDPDYYRHIVKQVPVLLIDRFVPNLSLCHIISADTVKIAEVVRKTVQHYQLSEYYYFGGQQSLSPSQSRLAGFKEGLRQAGLAETSGWIVHKDYKSESGYQMLAEVVAELGRLPQAIFTASYTILEGILRYLTEHHQMDKLLNQQLHLATFDDHDVLNALPFHIHSIKQDHAQIAQQIFSAIEQKLQGESPESVTVACEICWRDSEIG